MSRWLLDTDHVSLHERGHPVLQERLAAVKPNDVAICDVTVEEVLRGRLALLKRHRFGEARVRGYRKLRESVQFFNSIPVVAFDDESDRRFQHLLGERLKVGSQDLRIAATALVHHCIVVTRNQRDFGRIPGLQTEDWTVARQPTHDLLLSSQGIQPSPSTR